MKKWMWIALGVAAVAAIGYYVYHKNEVATTTNGRDNSPSAALPRR